MVQIIIATSFSLLITFISANLDVLPVFLLWYSAIALVVDFVLSSFDEDIIDVERHLF